MRFEQCDPIGKRKLACSCNLWFYIEENYSFGARIKQYKIEKQEHEEKCRQKWEWKDDNFVGREEYLYKIMSVLQHTDDLCKGNIIKNYTLVSSPTHTQYSKSLSLNLKENKGFILSVIKKMFMLLLYL